MNNPVPGKLAITTEFGIPLQYIELVMTQMPIPSRNISNQITFMNEFLIGELRAVSEPPPPFSLILQCLADYRVGLGQESMVYQFQPLEFLL